MSSWLTTATPTSTEDRESCVSSGTAACARSRDGWQWPNGMALVDDDRTLVVADSHAEQLVAFEVADDGTLASRRIWA